MSEDFRAILGGDGFANAALEPIVLRHGEHVDNGDRVIAQALEFMLAAVARLKDSRGLLIRVPATADLARRHLAAFLEEAMDLDMPERKSPNVVVIRGFGAP